MNSHMFNWDLTFWWYRIYWWLFGGKSIFVPMRDTTIVVDDKHHLWQDLGGATKVEITTDDPMWVYGPWLEEHVGKRNKDWHIILHVDTIPNWKDAQIRSTGTYTTEHTVEIQFHRRKNQWATACAMLWA